MSEETQSLRDHLVDLLEGGNAHADFDTIIANFPEESRGCRHDAVPYTAWQLLEHMRIAQWDIVQFCTNPSHKSPEWPEGYWPRESSPPSPSAWNSSVKALKKDLDRMKDLIADKSRDLFEPMAHGQGQTLLREALLVADHLSYHLGQMVLLRRLLNTWGETEARGGATQGSAG